MKRTAEELVALRKQREKDDADNTRKERARIAGRAKRRKLRDGDLVRELGLTTDELLALIEYRKGEIGATQLGRRLKGGRSVEEAPKLVEAAE